MFENYSWDVSFANFIDSLKVMGLGMLLIFVVIGILYASVAVLGKVTKEKKD